MADETPQLDAFLARGREPVSAETPEPAPEPAPTPEPQEKPAASPVAEPDDDDGDPPEPREGEPVVPRRALEDERHKRQDWKARAIQHETEAEGLRRQLAELKAAPPQQPPQEPQYQQPLDPVEAERNAREEARMLNMTLNVSERIARHLHGNDVVDAAVMDFKQAAAADPRLFAQLYQQPMPYDWLVQHVETLRLQREIGSDPAKWREAERERLRQEIAAEANNGNGSAPRISPAAGLPPSLANARSALPRNAPAWTGPTSFGDILAKRKF